jgi:hypothetical protein
VIGSRQDVHQGRAALDVPQEVVAETLALARAGDQAGHVGDDELRVARLGHAEVGDEGREGVVRDLGLGRRHCRDKG